ncbi:MAG: hypothetical protein JWR25_2414 [Noviherbaspirillum sp.]|nr:hypothetical protein [Noviherbaspirillum sp.]
MEWRDQKRPANTAVEFGMQRATEAVLPCGFIACHQVQANTIGRYGSIKFGRPAPMIRHDGHALYFSHRSCGNEQVQLTDLLTAKSRQQPACRYRFSSPFMEKRILNTTRQKRWNGKPETLQSDYLNEVISKMEAYGDRVQFALSGASRTPSYQVINPLDKKMAFDSNHHLLQGDAAQFDGSDVTAVFSLEEIRIARRGGGAKTRVAAPRTTGGTRTGTAASKILERIDTEKYEYFKNNREMLPSAIGRHSDEITQLMKNGMSAEEAFSDVLKRHF